MSTATVQNLVQAMKAGSITQNWDVALSFNAKKINERLRARFSKQQDSGMIKALDFSFKDYDVLGNEYNISYHIELGPPLIQFASTAVDPTCDLTMRILGGWTSIKDDKSDKKDIQKDKYTIDLSGLSLAAVEGDSEIKDGAIIALPDPRQKEITVTIRINFRITGKTPTVRVNFPDDDKSSMRNSNLPTYIMKEFQKDAMLRYDLASINNKAPPDNVLDLVPSKFIFTTYSPTVDSTETCLTFLIQTIGSDQPHGDLKNIQAVWITTWTKLNVAPIPLNRTACIVINNSFFMQMYIMKALRALKMTDLATVAAEDGGLRVTGKWPTPQHRPKMVKQDPVPIPSKMISKKVYHAEVPAKDFNPNEGGKQFTLTFAQANGTDKPGTIRLTWKWVFHDTWSGELEWSELSDTMPVYYIPKSQNISGSYQIEFTLDKTFDSPTLGSESFSIFLKTGENDWTAEVKNTAEPTFWDHFFSFFPLAPIGGQPAPAWVANAVPKPASVLDFNTLRFFLVTNILFPGEKVFKADLASGLLFPRDVVILGDIIDG